MNSWIRNSWIHMNPQFINSSEFMPSSLTACEFNSIHALESWGESNSIQFMEFNSIPNSPEMATAGRTRTHILRTTHTHKVVSQTVYINKYIVGKMWKRFNNRPSECPYMYPIWTRKWMQCWTRWCYWNERTTSLFFMADIVAHIFNEKKQPESY